jgi:hypothetical protein
MSEPTRISLGVSVGGEEGRKRVKKASLQQVISWIRSRGFEENTTNELIRIVSGYPIGTYYRFREDLQKHLIKIGKANSNKDDGKGKDEGTGTAGGEQV